MRVGIDLIEVSRIEKSLQSPRFLSRFFTDNERLLFTGAQKAKHVAADFAAKEALFKALGTGVRDFCMKDVEVLRDNYGAPYLSLHGNVAAFAANAHLSFCVSLTHTQYYAQAIVIGTSVQEEMPC